MNWSSSAKFPKRRQKRARIADNDPFSLATTLRGTLWHLRALPFEQIKNEVLGRRYALSLVLIGNTKSHTLNKRYRGKDKPTNVLSFSLDTETGEIYLNVHATAREARRGGVGIQQHALFLFIHGLLHLKGLEHGATMERMEQTLLKRFAS